MSLIAVIYGLNFSFKGQFLRISRRKNRRFFKVGLLFFVLLMIFYRSVLMPRKIPCPKKCLVTRQKRGEKVVWLNRLNFLIVSYLFAKFKGHRPCGRSDAKAKIVYVTLKDYVIKRSVDFMGGNSSLNIPWKDFVLMDT